MRHPALQTVAGAQFKALGLDLLLNLNLHLDHDAPLGHVSAGGVRLRQAAQGQGFAQPRKPTRTSLPMR